MKQFKVGLQLYSVRDAMAADFEGTLQAVKDMGYEYVEFAGYFGRTAEQIKEILDRIGLKHTVPQGSYFVMVDISAFLAKEKFAGWTDLQFCEWMVKEVGVAAVPGSSFFAEPVNHLIRLHFARSEESLREAVRRLGMLKKYL